MDQQQLKQQITSDGLNQMAMDMAISKWALPSEKTWGDIVDRASYFLATGEKMEKFDRSKINYDWDELLRTRSFIPNTPFWTNAGTDMKSLAACFVIGLEDTMVDIMETAKKMALIMKEGGGVGLTLSHIRPEFAKVGKGNSKRMASGPISFLKIFDAVVEAVKSAGVRRGAAMANLRVDHPDIIKFIECKTDQHTINNFNLSVAITDGFMRTLKERPDQLWVTDKRRVDVQENGKWTSKIVEKAYTAKEVFDLIVEHMWKNGEPGVQFIDNVNNSVYEEEVARDLRNLNKNEDLSYDPKEHVKYTGRPEFIAYNTDIEVSNPCVTGDTLVLTDKGYIPIIDLVGKKVNVWNGEEWSEVEPRKTAENQELLLIKYDDGSELKCTHYHNIPLVKGITAASEIKPGDKLIKFKYPSIEGEKELRNAYTQGVYSGDGTLYYPGGKKSGKEPLPFIEFYHEKKSIMKYCALLRKNNEATLLKNSVGNIPDIDFKDKSFVPDSSYTVQSRLDWLAGLIDTDGSKGSVEGSINITSINKPFLMDIKKMLSTLSVKSRVTVSKKAALKPMPDGKGSLKGYPCKECYRLFISALNVHILLEMGLQLHRVKVSPEPDRDTCRFITISSVEPLETKEDVYCFNEPKRHMFVANTQLTCNCSETFLLENEACNIGSINLYNYVIPFWQVSSGMGVANAHKVGAGWIKHLELKRDVEIAVDIMNRMIDLSEAPLEEINEAVRASRKIGIGVIGLADVMAACAVKYGSEESLKLIDFIMGECITKTAEKYSLSKDYKNATLTLCAPTGTTGFVANASQGIEPFFRREWKRFVRDEGEKLCAPRSLVEFKESEYYSSLDPEISEAAINTWWPTAHEVTPDEHLKVLLKVQEYQHNSVSKTINLPHDSTVADIQDLMRKAWLGGAKGFTCYRDGSRDSQVLYDSKLTKKNQLAKAENLSDKEEERWKKAEEIDNLISEDSALKAAKLKRLGEFEATETQIKEILAKHGQVCLTNQQFESMKKLATLGYQNYLSYVKNADSDNTVSSDKKEKRPRPIVTEGITHKLRTGCGNFYVTVNSDDKGICEVLTNIGRTGGCPSQSEAVSRLISLALRSGVTPESVIEQLKGIRCMSVIGKNRDGKLNNDIYITSCPDAIGKVMEKELIHQKEYALDPLRIISKQKQERADDKTQKATTPKEQKLNDSYYLNEKDHCPECGHQMTPDGGCRICQHCGYSKCN